MVQVAIGGIVKLESAHADIIQSLIINAEGLVRVLDELVDGQSSIVWLNNGVGDLRGWDDREGRHHTVWELLADLGDEESAHASPSTTTEGVGDLETLEEVTALGLATNDIENLVNEFGALSVMALRPVIASARLAKHEVVGAEELTEGASTDGIHGARLEVDEDGARDKLVAGGLWMLESGEFGEFGHVPTSLK
jgi:hypothetical protein